MLNLSCTALGEFFCPFKSWVLKKLITSLYSSAKWPCDLEQVKNLAQPQFSQLQGGTQLHYRTGVRSKWNNTQAGFHAVLTTTQHAHVILIKDYLILWCGQRERNNCQTSISQRWQWQNKKEFLKLRFIQFLALCQLVSTTIISLSFQDFKQESWSPSHKWENWDSERLSKSLGLSNYQMERKKNPKQD